MEKLNKIRLLCGIPIDPTIEITKQKKVVTEARTVPTRKRELTPKDEKTLAQAVAGIKSSIKHIEQAVRALDKIPSTDFMGEIPNYIQELEDLLDEGGTGMKAHLEACETNLRKHKRDVNAKAREEDEEAILSASEYENEDIAESLSFSVHETSEGFNVMSSKGDIHDGYDTEEEAQDVADKLNAKHKSVNEGKKASKDYDGDGKVESPEDEHKGVVDKAIKKKEKKEVKEAVHFFKNAYSDYEDDPAKPTNVSDGSSNGEQVYDKASDPKNTKNENPEQLRTSDEKSEQDQSDGADIEAEMKCPAAIMSSLKGAIDEARKESEKMKTSNKESSYFYNDMSRAFQDLHDHLSKGTRYDFKLGQHFAQSLMGPMLHKLPADVWKFLVNSGETRSLKDYMKPVKDPITGPRNTIK